MGREKISRDGSSCRVHSFAKGSLSFLDDDAWVVSLDTPRNLTYKKVLDAEDRSLTVSTADFSSDDSSIDSRQDHCPSSISDRVINAIFQELSKEELEIAARISFRYCQHELEQTSACLKQLREFHAKQMIRRHISTGNDDVKASLQRVKKTIQIYHDKEILDIRTMFHDNTNNASLQQQQQQRHRQQKLAHYLGDKGKMVVRGHDKHGRACIQIILKHSRPGTHNDREGAMLTFLHCLEKAIACSEKNGSDGTVIGCADLKGFQIWHIPPITVIVEMLLILKDAYREKLHRIYLVDAPVLARYMWNIIKPLMYHKIRDKCIFVTGQAQKEKVFGSGAFDLDHCMPYQHPSGKLTEPVDMEKYFKLPFDQAY